MTGVLKEHQQAEIARCKQVEQRSHTKRNYLLVIKERFVPLTHISPILHGACASERSPRALDRKKAVQVTSQENRQNNEDLGQVTTSKPLDPRQEFDTVMAALLHDRTDLPVILSETTHLSRRQHFLLGSCLLRILLPFAVLLPLGPFVPLSPVPLIQA